MPSIIIPLSVMKMGSYVFDGAKEDMVINVRASSKPDDWHDKWNEDYKMPGGRTVVWGYTGK